MWPFTDPSGVTLTGLAVSLSLDNSRNPSPFYRSQGYANGRRSSWLPDPAARYRLEPHHFPSERPDHGGVLVAPCSSGLACSPRFGWRVARRLADVRGI